MSKNLSGAELVRYALEQMPISHTFGIPGVHNTEIYDELNKSEKINPVLVTHEGGASFMADGVSRTGEGKIGTLIIVPAAGATHAMSGIAEAFLDGVPMLIITGGTRTDIDYIYQIHEVDQKKLLSTVTKGVWKINSHSEIVPTLFKAYETAISGMPGPVLVEIPVNVQLFKGPVDSLPIFRPYKNDFVLEESLIEQAVSLLKDAKHPGIFVGWGAVDVSKSVEKIAELLGAPVSTTLQGFSSFPGNHPLHTGMGFSKAAVPAAENAFKDCDCLLAIGTRFGEIPTGSFGCNVPENLIHIDINPEVFNKNFKAKVAITGDSKFLVPRLLEKIQEKNINEEARGKSIATEIAKDKAAYKKEWSEHLNERVNPSLFFDELRKQLKDDAIIVLDDGNHTFLTAELWENRNPRGLISPTDFNSMGYCVPATIGAKLVNPNKQVVGIVGDGCFLMTAMEIITGSTQNAGVIYFVFADGELSQISQGQEIPYNRKVCTILGNIKLEGIALATGAKYLSIKNNKEISKGISDALITSEKGQPVIVDISIDYSKRTRFTQGVVKTVLKRFPLGDKFRFIGRAIWRKITG